MSRQTPSVQASLQPHSNPPAAPNHIATFAHRRQFGCLPAPASNDPQLVHNWPTTALAQKAHNWPQLPTIGPQYNWPATGAQLAHNWPTIAHHNWLTMPPPHNWPKSNQESARNCPTQPGVDRLSLALQLASLGGQFDRAAGVAHPPVPPTLRVGLAHTQLPWEGPQLPTVAHTVAQSFVGPTQPFA